MKTVLRENVHQLSLPIATAHHSKIIEDVHPYYFSTSLSNEHYRKKSFALRYKVYCEERKFLSANSFPEKLEYDCYDAHSKHFGLLCKKGELLGSVRLVHDSGVGFPMEKHWDDLIPCHLRSSMAEISRLVICKQGSGKNKRSFSTLPMTLQLYLEIYKSIKENNMTHVLAAMEPSLVRLLRRFGFQFQEVGEEIDYYGLVKPYILTLQDFEQAITRMCPEVRSLFCLEDETRLSA